MEKELRMMEIRAVQTENNDEMIVEGYAIRFNEPTVLFEQDGIQYKEVIERGALDVADLRDVPLKYNHSDSVMIMARTRNKSLELIPDDQGLFIRAKLANTTTGKDLYELIRGGFIDKMSFAFTVKEDYYDRETHTRHIRKIAKLWDVSAVDTPAYETTSIYARSYFLAEVEKETLDREKRRRELLLRTYE